MLFEKMTVAVLLVFSSSDKRFKSVLLLLHLSESNLKNLFVSFLYLYKTSIDAPPIPWASFEVFTFEAIVY